MDHAIIRSIMGGSSLNFFLSDRSSKYWQTEPRKLRQNCPRLQKAYIFKVWLWARILRGRKWKNLFELEQLQRACSRTVIRPDNVRSIRGRSDFETWTDQTTKPRKPRNHESVQKKHFDKKLLLLLLLLLLVTTSNSWASAKDEKLYM